MDRWNALNELWWASIELRWASQRMKKVSPRPRHFLGKGVLKQVTKRREDIDGTMFTEGDIAIAIEWYDPTTATRTTPTG